MQEIEIKFLDIDPSELEKKLHSLGAKKVSDELLEEWIFKKPEWLSFHGRVRIRKANETLELAYKDTTRNSSEGNTEIEFVIDNAEHAKAFLEKLQVPFVRHQQKRRIHYVLDGISIDIDFWPKIPPFVEIEGGTKKALLGVAKNLGFEEKDICELDARAVIQDVYGVDVDSLQEYIF